MSIFENKYDLSFIYFPRKAVETCPKVISDNKALAAQFNFLVNDSTCKVDLSRKRLKQEMCKRIGPTMKQILIIARYSCLESTYLKFLSDRNSTASNFGQYCSSCSSAKWLVHLSLSPGWREPGACGHGDFKHLRKLLSVASRRGFDGQVRSATMTPLGHWKLRKDLCIMSWLHSITSISEGYTMILHHITSTYLKC